MSIEWQILRSMNINGKSVNFYLRQGEELCFENIIDVEVFIDKKTSNMNEDVRKKLKDSCTSLLQNYTPPPWPLTEENEQKIIGWCAHQDFIREKND